MKNITMFQSAPSPRAGRYANAYGGPTGYTRVSIRSQPEGREIHI